MQPFSHAEVRLVSSGGGGCGLLGGRSSHPALGHRPPKKDKDKKFNCHKLTLFLIGHPDLTVLGKFAFDMNEFKVQLTEFRMNQFC